MFESCKKPRHTMPQSVSEGRSCGRLNASAPKIALSNAGEVS
jgi:hypothetical protein